ncbi:hypothetical protein [Austwickia chelonae]|nr:hypothetical protein [Austwickia chelonae]
MPLVFRSGRPGTAQERDQTRQKRKNDQRSRDEQNPEVGKKLFHRHILSS